MPRIKNIILIIIIFLAVNLFFTLDSISSKNTDLGTGGAQAGIAATAGTGPAQADTATGKSGSADVKESGAADVGESSSKKVHDSIGRVSPSPVTQIEVQKYMSPLKPKKREDIEIELVVTSNPKDISSITLQDEIPEGFKFKSADPVYSQIINSTKDRSGKITWTYKYSGDKYRISNEFKYILTSDNKTDKELKAAILTAWDKNNQRLQPILSNTIICTIPNEPPYFETLPESPMRLFDGGNYNIKTIVKDPDNDNFTCVLIVDNKTIEPTNTIDGINEYSWNIYLSTEQQQVYLRAIDEEGESKVEPLEIKPSINPIEDFVGYVNAIAVIIAGIFGAIAAIIGVAITNRSKPKIFLINSLNNENLPENKKIVARELGPMSEAIKAIGQANAYVTTSTLQGTVRALLENGYEGAEAYAAQFIGTDQNTELLRVLIICKRYNLSPESAAIVLENFNMLESGKW